MMLRQAEIKAIVFDLDGTLYVSERFEQVVWQSAARYAGDLLGVSAEEGGRRITALRQRLTEERGTLQTLAVAIEVMGGTVPDLHRRFAEELEPRHHIEPDPRVTALVEGLGQCYNCWLLTNNNRTLTDKILTTLGLESAFERVITINDTWRPKPDESVLDEVLEALGHGPEQVLFVGDRYDIDLRLPAARGCPVLHTTTVDDLMALAALL